METPSGTSVRLQRVLADAGVGSRRHCEALIEQGRVSVDGQPVTRQGVKVDPASVVVRVDGDRIVTDTTRRYVLLNKPVGVLSAMSDERGRPTVAPAARGHRLFHVGRLDADTSGLLLLTNDGELAHRLMHPSYEVAKTYVADVDGDVGSAVRARLRRGVLLDDGPAAVDRVRVLGSAPGRTLLELSVHEGRNRLVRRLLAAVGHPVVELVRVGFGPLRLGELGPGRTRALTGNEVKQLYRLVDL
ncbi:MAG TPA: pseudouridine synthase [Mycobacteriales bacterium]